MNSVPPFLIQTPFTDARNVMSPEFARWLEELRLAFLDLSEEVMGKPFAIYQGQVPAATTLIYTATQTSRIASAVVCNTTGTGRALQVWIAQDGAAAGDANKVYDALTVGANTEAALSLLDGQVLPAGAKVYAEASAVALTLTISGN